MLIDYFGLTLLHDQKEGNFSVLSIFYVFGMKYIIQFGRYNSKDFHPKLKVACQTMNQNRRACLTHE
jgi:hypothetical protein